MSQIPRSSYKAAVIHGHADPETFRNWRSQTFGAAVATSRSEYLLLNEKYYEEIYLLFTLVLKN